MDFKHLSAGKSKRHAQGTRAIDISASAEKKDLRNVLFTSTTVGRKNWLFSDTPAGAEASACLYSLVETAKAKGLEPYAYLRRVFTDLPRAKTIEDAEALLSWNITPMATHSRRRLIQDRQA